MAIEGYVEYPKRLYCRESQCPVQALLDDQKPESDAYNKIRVVCQTGCLRTSHGFHRWLIDNGYLVVKPA